MNTLIKGGCIVNEAHVFDGSIVIENEKIAAILQPNQNPEVPIDQVLDASGCYILPGLIDEHVHFREPGLTEKADIDSESRAAAAGGVTTYFDMPNTMPQTTTIEALDEKFRLAAQKSHVNYSFFFGATNTNIGLFKQLDPHRVPGIKLFMGSSTGNMLVDREDVLEYIFRTAQLPIMTHCEETSIINHNMAEAKRLYGNDPDIVHHPTIRSEEACYTSTLQAVKLAEKFGTHLHVAHVSTARELQLFGKQPNITAEATVAHLFFCDKDYHTLGARIKCNPAIKRQQDREALQQALSDGRINVIGTDHAPHLLVQKQGGAACATSGIPMLQFSLVSMLELVDEGVLSIERLVELMCHNPARLFHVQKRGFLRTGYQADLVIVKPNTPWTLTSQQIQSKCKWSPMEGHTFQWKVMQTFCNGHLIYNNDIVDTHYIGQSVLFR